jgi:hypothetical protein
MAYALWMPVFTGMTKRLRIVGENQEKLGEPTA